ncbi:hypothetical protein L1987_31300 [Smallanthus sonchifolius]|uniref:Uncharacterized protein n=1 Tax=Smallanthus sonchifolius TaxID=185202 RepID=A0ACB9I5X8_9ASTR|nr:hypothetical protein L1987_31300 [Smallanthus sonchifolius]
MKPKALAFFNKTPAITIFLFADEALEMGRLLEAISPTPLLLNEESSSKKHHPSVIVIFLGGLIVLLILLILIFVFWKFIRAARPRKSVKRDNSCKDYFSGNLRTISYFSFQALKKATKNFHECNFLGKGGFGPVYLSSLQRFFPEDQAYLSTAFAGTLGYTAPEYAIKGELSEKVDIYSFGVLVLEIISCRKNTDLTLPSEMQYLPEYAWKLYERSRMVDLIDPRMKSDGFMEKDVMQTIRVALLCIQPHANLRPPMSEIVAMLTWKVEMVKSPIKPTFLNAGGRHIDEIESWEAISDYFPSPLESESLNLTQPPNSLDSSAIRSFSRKIGV